MHVNTTVTVLLHFISKKCVPAILVALQYKVGWKSWVGAEVMLLSCFREFIARITA
jgi:hypothetical protein